MSKEAILHPKISCAPYFGCFEYLHLQCTLDNPVTCAQQIWTGLWRGPGYPGPGYPEYTVHPLNGT
jgi:hypothetical protein